MHFKAEILQIFVCKEAGLQVVTPWPTLKLTDGGII